MIRHYRSEERPEGTDEYLFYDIKNDPLEIVNQVENVKFSEEISKLKIILANWQKEKNDFLPSEFD